MTSSAQSELLVRLEAATSSSLINQMSTREARVVHNDCHASDPNSDACASGARKRELRGNASVQSRQLALVSEGFAGSCLGTQLLGTWWTADHSIFQAVWWIVDHSSVGRSGGHILPAPLRAQRERRPSLHPPAHWTVPCSFHWTKHQKPLHRI